MRLALFVVAVLAVAHSAAYAEQRYALVIGANPGWSQDRPLRYAENDAERVRDVLVVARRLRAGSRRAAARSRHGEVRATLREARAHRAERAARTRSCSSITRVTPTTSGCTCAAIR